MSDNSLAKSGTAMFVKVLCRVFFSLVFAAGAFMLVMCMDYANTAAKLGRLYSDIQQKSEVLSNAAKLPAHTSVLYAIRESVAYGRAFLRTFSADLQNAKLPQMSIPEQERYVFRKEQSLDNIDRSIVTVSEELMEAVANYSSERAKATGRLSSRIFGGVLYPVVR